MVSSPYFTGMVQLLAFIVNTICLMFVLRLGLDGLAALWRLYTDYCDQLAERQRLERIARDDAINARIEAEIAAGH